MDWTCENTLGVWAGLDATRLGSLDVVRVWWVGRRSVFRLHFGSSLEGSGIPPRRGGVLVGRAQGPSHGGADGPREDRAIGP